MRKMVLVLIVVLIACSQVFAAAKDISSREAKTLLETNKNIFLLDVRTPMENKQARIPGTILIPIKELERRINEVPKSKTIMVYCTVGARSKQVAEYLSQKGYKEVYNMADGIAGWSRNNFQIQK